MLLLVKRFAVAFLVLGLAMPACSKKEDEDEDEEEAATDAPPPPSPYTVSIDLSASEEGTNTDEQAANGAGFADLSFLMNTSQLAHLGASVVVVTLSASLAAQLTVPVLLLKGAEGASPVESSENVYLWSYDFSFNNVDFTANLTGTKGSEANTWSMKLTRNPEDGNGCCENFEFFTGTQNGQSGSWQLYDPSRPAAQEELFSVSYDVTSATERSLTFLVNSDRPATEAFGAGTKVEYVMNGTTVKITYTESSVPGVRVITFDTGTKAGSFVTLEGETFCWDTALNGYADIECPDAAE